MPCLRLPYEFDRGLPSDFNLKLPGIAQPTLDLPLHDATIGSRRFRKELAYYLRAVADLLDPPALHFVPSVGAEPHPTNTAVDSDAVDHRESERRSLAAIEQALRTVAIEDGYNHAAERILSAHVASFGEAALLDVVISADAPADWVRLLGRATNLGPTFRMAIVSWGLGSVDVRVRDAAIQAVENWEDHDLVGLLRGHDEHVDWLRSYAEGVVHDLEA
jgi:hypothetical protein